MQTIILTVNAIQVDKLPWQWYLPYHEKRGAINCSASLLGNKLYEIMKASTQEVAIIITDKESLEAVAKVLPQHTLWEGKSKPSFGTVQGYYCKIGRVHLLVAPSRERLYARDIKVAYSVYLSKIYRPDKWLPKYPLRHQHLDSEPEARHIISSMLKDKPLFLAVDLETTRNLAFYDFSSGELCHNFGGVIDLVNVSFVYANAATYSIETFTWDFTREWHIYLLRIVTASGVPTVMHNGMYDSQYLTRWGAPPKSYLWDTLYGYKSYYGFFEAEAKPYNLGATSAMWLRENTYWKDGIKSEDRASYIKYGAADSHNTAAIAIAQLAAVNRETFVNFLARFANVPACLLGSLRGMHTTVELIRKMEHELEAEKLPAQQWVRNVLGVEATASGALLPILNQLLEVAANMGVKYAKPIKDTQAKSMADFAYVHPVFELLATKLGVARRNWVRNYVMDADGSHKFLDKRFNGAATASATDPVYFVYELNPFGTSTGRLSATASGFWCGFNAQNAPVTIRKMFKPPQGYVFVASDAPQSETRTTAFFSGCIELRNAVEGDKDYHKLNAEAFFGTPYDQVTSVQRKAGKPVAHGANYNMAAYTLLATMGIKAVIAARQLLGLSDKVSPFDVCVYLLRKFDATYPRIRNEWYVELVLEVYRTSRLSMPSGFCPLVLSDPLETKSNLNSIVSVKPQSLSAYLNLRASTKLMLLEFSGELPGFKFVLQIHDENVGIVPIGTKVAHVDAAFNTACYNSTEFDYVWSDTGKQAVLSIPVGKPSFSGLWSGLKEDPVARPNALVEVQELLM